MWDQYERREQLYKSIQEGTVKINNQKGPILTREQ